MNYLQNHDDSSQDQPIFSLGPSKSKPGPVVQKNETSPEIAEQALASNRQPLINSIQYKSRDQSNVNLPEMTALDLEPQNGEQDIKLADDVPPLRFNSKDQVKLSRKIFIEDPQREKFSSYENATKRFISDPVEKETQKQKFSWRTVKKYFQKKKKEGSQHEGIWPVEELQKFYERKRAIKNRSHLDCIPKAHQGGINCVIFSPDYQFIISGSDDFSIKVFDVETGEEKYQLPESSENKVKLLAMTLDGKHLISGYEDKSLKIFDFPPKQSTPIMNPIKEKCLHYSAKQDSNLFLDPISLLDVTDDKNIFYGFVAHDVTEIKLFDLVEKRPSFKRVFDQRVKFMKAVSNSEAALLTEDGSIVILDLESGKSKNFFRASDSGRITSFAFQFGKTKDQDLIFAGCDDGSVKIFNLSDWGEVDRFECEFDRQGTNPVKQVALSDDGQFVCAGFQEGSLVRWNRAKNNEKKVLQGKYDKWDQFALSKKADFLITFCEGHQSILFIDIEPRERNVICLESSHGGIKSGEEQHKKISFAITQDSKYIISAAHSGLIHFFDVQTKQEVPEKSFKLEGNIFCITVTPNNKFFIVLFEDGRVEVFDFENSGPQPSLYNDFGNIFEGSPPMIAVTPDDSRFLIAISKERTSFRMFDLIEKKEISPLSQIHETAIHSVIVTPNNKYVISASDDLSIKIFDLDTKDLVHQFFYSHDDQITALSMSPGNGFVASGSKDCSVRIFDIKAKQLVHHLANIHNEGVKKIEFAPNNKYLVSLSEDGSLKFINFETVMEAEQMRRCENLSAIVSKNNQLICVTSDLEVKDAKTEEPVLKIENKVEGEIKSMTVSLDNKFLICGTSLGNVGVYELEDETQFQILNGPETFMAITAVALTSDNQYIIIGSQDKRVKVIVRETGKIHQVFKDLRHDPINSSRGPCYSIGVVPNSQNSQYSQSVILSTGDKSLRILNIKNHPEASSKNDSKASLKKDPEVDLLKNVHQRTIRCVAVSRNGKFFASCSDDRCVKIFAWKTKELIHWFKNVHKDPFSTITFSQDCRFLITGSLNKSIKVFDIQTLQQVHHFNEIHTSDIKFITTTPDNKYIVSTFLDNCIKIFKLIPTSPPFLDLPTNQETFDFYETSQSKPLRVKNGQNIRNQEIYYVYCGVLNYSNFNAVDTFLFHSYMPIENVCVTAGRCQNLTVYPYQWNILHIVAIKQSDVFLKKMPEYSKLKVPFLLDAFSKTPLHYLFDYTPINLGYVNTMLNYICDYLDDLGQDQRYQAQKIILSLTSHFWFLLEKPDVKVRARFFGLCSIVPPMPYEKEPPTFGEMKTDVQHFLPTLESISSFVASMCEEDCEKGKGQINFRVNIFKLDYNVLSADMKKTIKCLSHQKNEDIFKTTLIIDLIDYLWEQVKFIEIITFALFSAYIIALSVYLSLENRSLPYEIVILCCSTFYLLCEVFQSISIKKDYLNDIWNVLDLSFHPLTIGYVIARISGLENQLVRAWISSIILLLGYLRWISNLRIFKPTRNLIEVILTVVKDMWSFVVIIAAIIIGFSFIFLVFNRGSLYGFYLYVAYSSLYEPATNQAATSSELVLIALIAFLLNVILLNLLISIMSDSYVKVLEQRIKTDSLTRLDIISEAVSILRCLRFIRFQRLIQCSWCLKRFRCLGGNPDLKKGFLVRCKSVSSTDDDDDGDKWEGRLSIFRKLFKQSENSTEKEIQKFQQDLYQNLARIDHKRNAGEERIEEKLLAELEKMRNQQNKKIDKILALFIEVNQKLDRQPNDQEHQEHQEHESSGKVNPSLKRNITL